MECYITYCIKGFLAFNSKNELICEKLFPKDEIINRLIQIDSKEIVLEEKKIIDELYPDYDEIIIESNKKSSDYNLEKLKIKTPNPAGDYLRENYEKFGLNEKEVVKIYQQLAIYKIKKESASEDKHLIQAINSIDEVDNAIAKLNERIREWYSLYFPEMEIIRNNETYIKLIAENKTKLDIVNAKRESFPKEIIDIEEEINPMDLEIMNNYANSIYGLQKNRENMEKYIGEKMESIAPNLKLLVGSTLGAKLISHAGGLKRLATYPSSTVQIMGAEKALFRHLKSGDRPPKYGLIYQHPQVRGAKWWNRGKIARMLAGKISLAVRRDVFTKTFDENVYDDFLENIELIEKNNPFPTKTTKKRKEERSKSKTRKKKSKKKNKRR